MTKFKKNILVIHTRSWRECGEVGILICFLICYWSEKAMAPHSTTFAWKIPWTEEPGRLQFMGLLESDTTERLHFHFSLSCIGEGNGNPLQCTCLEDPREGKPGWLPSMGSHRVGHDWSDAAAAAAAWIKNDIPLSAGLSQEPLTRFPLPFV